MTTLIYYHGIQILDADPDPTADAGLAIQNNFRALADRAPYSVWTEPTPPGTGDDNGAGFYEGSLWLVTSLTAPSRLFMCQSSATGAAVWLEVLLSSVTTPVTLEDGVNITVGSSTGTKIGTSTSQLLGFYDATPVAQRSGAAQDAVDTTPATNVSPYGFSQTQADGIVTLVNELRAWAVAQGFIKGSA